MLNRLLCKGDSFIRVLYEYLSQSMVIDCINKTMPKWISNESFVEFTECSESDLLQFSNVVLVNEEDIPQNSRSIMYRRYNLIIPILPYVDDISLRSQVIKKIASDNGLSSKTVMTYLCNYLSYMDKRILAPSAITRQRELTVDEKNIRWGLNKFYYTKHKNNLHTAYEMTLRAKYCDGNNVLLPSYPSYNQFRYFYRRHRNLRTEYISRNGFKYYQRNQRPLLGDSVTSFAPAIGTAMLDSTICDIFLVDDCGNSIGRPKLTACVDAYSRLCCGYLLSLEGGIYSLRGLLSNVVTDKVEWCRKFGIEINSDEWNCSDKLPSVFVTDMGREYQSFAFEQITELGVTVINLPPYRPELKSCVEKFFDIIQNLYKPHLKGKGVIESDYHERGASDYRLDACLTITDFEKIIIRCILYYNNNRIIENFPYTQDMLDLRIQPTSSAIWNWQLNQKQSNFIIPTKSLMLALLPRCDGKFTRKGLVVNGIRYTADGYTEHYLHGGKCVVAYNTDNISTVWLYSDGNYTPFTIIDSRYAFAGLSDVSRMKKSQQSLIKEAKRTSTQSKIDLINHIGVVAQKSVSSISLKRVRTSTQRAKKENHIDYIRGDDNDDK